MKLAEPLGFPVAYGMTRNDADLVGACEERRNHIQPSEFVVNQRGKALMSTYSTSPIGRMDPEEALSLVRFLNTQRQKN